jgi:hypothetical protein
MDKVLIASGASLLWLALSGKHETAFDTVNIMLKKEGFISVLVLFAILFTIQTQAPKYSTQTALVGVILLLGFYNRLNSGDNKL